MQGLLSAVVYFLIAWWVLANTQDAEEEPGFSRTEKGIVYEDYLDNDHANGGQ